MSDAVSSASYLIIGGAPKAGTTSLFRWLAAHPQVCASSIKETRFFLDADYPVPCAVRFNGSNLADYDGYFRHCKEQRSLIRVDATPDYLYSGTAVRIAELLPKARIVFIVRDPVDRMVSWYKYARQRGMIGNGMSFQDYVLEQAGRPPGPATPVHLRALDQCRYENYLQPFRHAFGGRCLIIEFEALKNDPCGTVKKLCAFAGLDGAFYESYSFRAENVSRVARSGSVSRAYNAVRRRIAHALYDSPRIMQLFRRPNRIIKKILAGQERAYDEVTVPSDLSALIRRESRRRSWSDCD